MQETQETRIQSLDEENPLEEEMATHSSIRAREILWIEEPGELQSIVLQKVKHDYVTECAHTHRQFIWEVKANAGRRVLK